MSLCTIFKSTKPLWSSPFDDVVSEVLVPGLSIAKFYDCMAGFFSSGSIAELSPGLARFLQNHQHRMRLLISPIIEERDAEYIHRGLTMTDEEASVWASEFLGASLARTETRLEKHTRQCLAYLLALNRIEIKIVVTQSGIFHRKNFIIKDGEYIACLSGSANLTAGGLRNNHETMQLSCSWKDDTQASICAELQQHFTKYWNNSVHQSRTIGIGSAVRQQIIARYAQDTPPSNDEFIRLLAEHNTNPSEHTTQAPFAIPSDLIWQEGPYAHQGQAITAWENNDYRGVISLATGGGKTLTSLIAAQRLYQRLGLLNIVIVVPTKPLALQWHEECLRFGLNPISPFQYSDISAQLSDIQLQSRALDRGAKTIACCIILNGTLRRIEFQHILSRLSSPTLLIADECHNLGTKSLLQSLPSCIDHRIGLSATPLRQYDIEGSLQLEAYFGRVIYSLPIADAIGVCLVPYDYYIVPCFLDDEECEEFSRLSYKIRRLSGSIDDISEPSDSLKMLLIRRARILELANSKIAAFADFIDGIQAPLKKTIVFCTEKGASQLESVNKVLSDRNIIYRQVTQKETSISSLTSSIINDFRSGRLEVLTAKRVLNEGANIPEVETAFFLGSSSVRREWIQRRGRVLRRCDSTGKTQATIIDFIVLPPLEYKNDCASAVRTEIARCEEFAASSSNRYDEGSGRLLMERLKLDYLY